MKKIMLLSLVMISILQGSEFSIQLCNSLGVFYEDSSKPLITASPWDNATHEDISRRTALSFISEKRFPSGNFAYLINEINNTFHIQKVEYNQQLQKYNNPRKIERELLDLNLQDCSFVVYNGGTGLESNALLLAAQFISKAYENKVPCVINYPTNKKSEILPLIKNKNVHYFSSWNDIKEKMTALGFAFGVLALIWYVNPLNSLFS